MRYIGLARVPTACVHDVVESERLRPHLLVAAGCSVAVWEVNIWTASAWRWVLWLMAEDAAGWWDWLDHSAAGEAVAAHGPERA